MTIGQDVREKMQIANCGAKDIILTECERVYNAGLVCPSGDPRHGKCTEYAE